MKKNSFILFLYLAITSHMVMAEAVLQPDQIIQQREEIRQAHFKNIDELIELRAPGLALNYVRREHAEYDKDDPVEWLYWEQKYVSLLTYMGRWQELDQRVNQQLENLQTVKVATADRNWFLTEQLRALIQLKQFSTALNKARSLIWNASVLVNSATIASWRRLIIQIYLQQGELNDARIAMRRYQQDYGELKNEDGVSWLQLQAELYVKSEQYNDAITLLQKVDTDEAKALTLLAQLKAELISPQESLNRIELLLAESNTSQDKSLFEYVSLVSAVQLSNTEIIIRRFESLLSVQKNQLSDSLVQIAGVPVNADELWKYYLRLGNSIANAQGLLKGDDAGWYLFASNLFKTEKLHARALFAVLSLHAKETKHRNLAMRQLVSLVEEGDQSLQLVNRLFTESVNFTDTAIIPVEVRYRLIDYNLSLGSVKAAAALMAELKQPPADQDKFDWSLRRARVLILNADFSQGVTVLQEILNISDTAVKPLSKPQVDKFIQVVFDLQAVEQHQAAIELFTVLERTLDDVNVLRELSFWKAESYFGLQQYEQAAYLFLKSAVSPKKEYDPWYHTATFRAAESLMSAGLYEDARQRFLHLLSITGNAARKTVIRQRLQSIRLKQQVE